MDSPPARARRGAGDGFGRRSGGGPEPPRDDGAAGDEFAAGGPPRIFKDPDPYSYYPNNVRETDGLGRNPDDCVRWGCIDQNGK
jgi:hypothetical protein